jgi:hypothetical protein
VGLNEVYSMVNFRGLLASLPLNANLASKMAAVVYLLACLISIFLWLKIYPPLKETSEWAFELIASISTAALVVFSLHGYEYDYLLMVIPCLWLYIWSTTDDTKFNRRQNIIRLFITLVSFSLPFLFWTNLQLANAENTNVGYQIRIFTAVMILLGCAIAATIMEFKKSNYSAIRAK